MAFQISPTTLKYYRLCPFRYQCYLDPQIKQAYKRETPALTQGQLVHGVLNSCFKELSKEDRTEENLRRLYKEKFLANKDKHFQIFRDQKTIIRYVKESQREFQNFLDSPLSRTEPYEATEKLFECFLEGDIRLIAKIDRIDLEEKGFHIIDYKTGRLREEEPDPFQLNIYALIATKNLNKPVARKSYFYLLDGKLIDVPVQKGEQAKILDLIVTTVQEIKKDKKFEARTNNECCFCDYHSLCPLKKKVSD